VRSRKTNLALLYDGLFNHKSISPVKALFIFLSLGVESTLTSLPLKDGGVWTHTYSFSSLAKKCLGIGFALATKSSRILLLTYEEQMNHYVIIFGYHLKWINSNYVD
jgi:hypothetical protein